MKLKFAYLAAVFVFAAIFIVFNFLKKSDSSSMVHFLQNSKDKISNKLDFIFMKDVVSESQIMKKNLSLDNTTAKETFLGMQGHSVMQIQPGYLKEADEIKNLHLNDLLLTRYQTINDDKVVVLASLDSGYFEMAMNLWESFLLNNISNYLFTCSDKKAAILLQQYDISCYIGDTDKDSEKPSSYGSSSFARKTHLKTNVVLQTLKLGYAVLFVDLDIVFLKNPFDHLKCKDCDIQIQWDVSEINSGFYFVRPTPLGIQLFQDTYNAAVKNPKVSQQKHMSSAFKRLKTKKLQSVILSANAFPNGFDFFEKGKRMFASDHPCTTCVAVHNNWIVSKAAKIYRFKEMLMWTYDQHQYYSNQTAKYLKYNNPTLKESNVDLEIRAFKTALIIGYITNRIVILPAFSCSKCNFGACKVSSKECSLNTHIHIETLDKYFLNKYREHSFLKHPKVPNEFKSDFKEIFFMEDKYSKKTNLSQSYDKNEVSRWFQPLENEPIVHLYSLYSVEISLSKTVMDEKLLNALNTYVRSSDYRNYRHS